MLNIEPKEDSAEKLAAIAGKPTKHYLYAPEFNQLVVAINTLATNAAFSKFTTYINPTVVGGNFTAPANQAWEINAVGYTNPDAVTIPIVLSAAGLKKFVAFYATTNNTFVMISGTESANPMIPTDVPVNSLLYSIILVTDSLIGTPTEPAPGIAYQTKAEKGDSIYSIGPYEYVSANEASRARITFQTTGFLKAIKTWSGNLNLYPGKEYTIKNETGAALTLKNLDTTLTGLDYKKFWFPNAADLVLQNGESAKFVYSNGRFEFNGSNKISKRQWTITTAALQFLNFGSGNWFKKPNFNTSNLTISIDTGFTDKASLSIHTVDFVAPFNCYLKEVEIVTAFAVDFSVVIHKSDSFASLNTQEIYYKASANVIISESVSSGVMVKKGGGIALWLKQLGTLTSNTKYGKMTLIFEEA